MLPSLHNLPLHDVAPTGMRMKPEGFYYHASAADVANDYNELEYYDPNAPDYEQVAYGAIVQSLNTVKECDALRYVPYDHPLYYKLARMTIQLDAASINAVDPRMGRETYMAVAKDAIDRMPEVIDKGYIRPSRVPDRPDYDVLVAYAEKVKAEKSGARGDDDGPVYRTWEREAGRALDAQREREAMDEMKEFMMSNYGVHRSRPSSPMRSAIQKKHVNRRLGR